MKILFIQETDWLKRGPHQQHHLAEMMSLRGHEIRAIDHEISWKTENAGKLYSRRSLFSDNVPKVHKDAIITVIRPGFIRMPVLDYISIFFSHMSEIKRQIKEFSPDVIIGLGILNSLSATLIVKRMGVPFIFYWIDSLHLLIPNKLLRGFGKLLECIILKRMDTVLTINDKLKDLVVSMGAPTQRTHVIRAGINIRQFDPGTKGDQIRKQYGFKEQDTVLFFMGFIYHFAGLKEVILKMAESDNNRLKMLVVGEGDAYDELKQMREKYKLQDKVVLAGQKPYQDMPAYIASADICVLPAYPDELIMQDIVPIKLYEYMAMGKPVIATRLPGVVKEFGDNNGIIYIEKPEETVNKAIELVASGSINNIGVKARLFAERNSWDSITDEFEGLLKQVIKEKSNEKLS